jgi:hypothetical protein
LHDFAFAPQLPIVLDASPCCSRRQSFQNVIPLQPHTGACEASQSRGRGLQRPDAYPHEGLLHNQPGPGQSSLLAQV